jgi:hypothetical protein
MKHIIVYDPAYTHQGAARYDKPTKKAWRRSLRQLTRQQITDEMAGVEANFSSKENNTFIWELW